MLSRIRKLIHSVSTTGFTMVELITVITVIGILTTISVLAFTGWRQSVVTSQLKSDLNGAVSAMEDARNLGNSGYPVIVPSTFAKSNGDVLSGNGDILSGGSSDGGKSYCISIVNPQYPTIIYHIDSTASQGPQPGACVTYTLSVVSGFGGTVSSGGTYRPGATQTITATPNVNSTFTSWTGSPGCAGTASHSITIDANKTCTANFSYTVDSYDVSNYTVSDNHIFTATNTAYGQSFTSNGGKLASTKFMLSKFGLPTCSMYSKIYSHTGTFGTSGTPTGAALATSDAVSASTLTTTPQLINFNFTGSNNVILTNGTKYVATVECSGGNGSNYVKLGEDGTSPASPGNLSWYYNSNWWPDDYSNFDLIFYIYGI